MGHWDPEALAQMLADGLDATRAGFDAMDLTMLLGDAAPLALDTSLPASIVDAVDQAEEIAALKRRKQEYKRRAKIRDDAEFYLVVVFRDRARTTAALDLLGLHGDERYVDGERIMSALEGYYARAPGSPGRTTE